MPVLVFRSWQPRQTLPLAMIVSLSMSGQYCAFLHDAHGWDVTAELGGTLLSQLFTLKFLSFVKNGELTRHRTKPEAGKLKAVMIWIYGGGFR